MGDLVNLQEYAAKKREAFYRRNEHIMRAGVEAIENMLKEKELS